MGRIFRAVRVTLEGRAGSKNAFWEEVWCWIVPLKHPRRHNMELQATTKTKHTAVQNSAPPPRRCEEGAPARHRHKLCVTVQRINKEHTAPHTLSPLPL